MSPVTFFGQVLPKEAKVQAFSAQQKKGGFQSEVQKARGIFAEMKA